MIADVFAAGLPTRIVVARGSKFDKKDRRRKERCRLQPGRMRDEKKRGMITESLSCLLTVRSDFSTQRYF
jgi:hypothetical protein